jgi:osmotically inducible lipoprotein OsmB
MRVMTCVVVAALTTGVLGCSPSPTYRTAGAAALGGTAGVLGGALIAGPVGAVAGGAAGAATGAALVAPNEERLR